MINDFPILEQSECALLIVKASTGQVLDEKYELLQGEILKAFKIFNSIESATNFAQEIVSSIDNIEIVIYDRNNQAIKVINNEM